MSIESQRPSVRSPREAPSPACRAVALEPAAGVPRWVDVLASGFALCLLFPLLVLVWLLIRVDSPGPALFRQRRVGRHGRQFTCWKFRTMADGAALPDLEIDDLTSYVFSPRRATKDPRLTRVGAVLRRTSVDELPQLMNVIRGEMALVGPRPEVPEIVERYPEQCEDRHAVLPGITGLAQINGRSDLAYGQSLSQDLRYARCRDVRMDLAILGRTLGCVFRAEGAR
jgi:lipopolysaccharide/colanic/teichoic acid biosynthesis glycosyltransferase